MCIPWVKQVLFSSSSLSVVVSLQHFHIKVWLPQSSSVMTTIYEVKNIKHYSCIRQTSILKTLSSLVHYYTINLIHEFYFVVYICVSMTWISLCTERFSGKAWPISYICILLSKVSLAYRTWSTHWFLRVPLPKCTEEMLFVYKQLFKHSVPVMELEWRNYQYVK